MSMYHWEADQEGFLVLSGEALLIVEDEERPLRQWDYFHCPPDVPHTIVGAGSGPAAILAIGAREHQDGADWGGYPYSERRDEARREQPRRRRPIRRSPTRASRRRADGEFREDWLP